MRDGQTATGRAEKLHIGDSEKLWQVTEDLILRPKEHLHFEQRGFDG
jgi:hypothetical protein